MKSLSTILVGELSVSKILGDKTLTGQISKKIETCLYIVFF